MIEKCVEFKRWLDPRKSIYNEVQICTATGIGGIRCGGFSDNCLFPDKFKSVRGLSKGEITFRFENNACNEE